MQSLGLNCCPNPRVSSLSDKKYVIGETGAYEPIAIVNKICLNCLSHQYGENDGKFYTKKEWENLINDTMD